MSGLPILTGRASGTSVTSSSGVPETSRDIRATIDCGETCPSPTATYRASRSAYFRSSATRAIVSSDASRLNVWSCRRTNAFTASRPDSIASSRRPRLNHWRIFVLARGVFTNWSQSWLGPSPCAFDAEISTVSPVRSS